MYSSTKPQSSWGVVPFTVSGTSVTFWVRTCMCSLNGGWIWIEATTGGQKCCDLSAILVKLATPPLPPQTKLNFEQMGGMTAFLDTTLLAEGEWGDDGMYPKEMKKLSLGAESYLEGLFHTVQSSLIFTLHCRFPFNRGSKYKDYLNILSGTRFWVPWMGVSQRRGCTAM